MFRMIRIGDVYINVDSIISVAVAHENDRRLHTAGSYTGPGAVSGITVHYRGGKSGYFEGPNLWAGFQEWAAGEDFRLAVLDDSKPEPPEPPAHREASPGGFTMSSPTPRRRVW